MKFLRKINLEINKDLYDPIKVKQNDTARYLLFNLLDDRVPFSLENKTVRVYGLKPDGTKVFNNLTIVNAQGGLAELQLTSQMLAKSGWLKLELVIYEATDILSTIKFDIDVIASLRDDTAIESTNEFSALTLALKSVQEWEKYFEEESGKIEEKYTERLNGFDSSLEEKVNKEQGKGLSTNDLTNELLELLKTITDKVDMSTFLSKVWNMANLGQDVKEAMTGGSVAVVGKSSVNNESVVDNQIYERCVSFIKQHSKNLFDKDYVSSGIITETGEVTTNSIYVHSDYIPVTPGEKITITKGLTTGGCAFDANRKSIGKPYTVSTVTSPFTFTVPNNVASIRLNIPANELDKFVICKGETLVDYQFATYKLLNKIIMDKSQINDFLVNKDECDFIEIPINLFNKDAVTEGLMLNNGVIDETKNIYCVSDFIKFDSNSITVSKSYTSCGCAYDKNKNLIQGGITCPSIQSPYTFTKTNPNIKYIRLNLEKSLLDTYMVVNGDELPNNYENCEYKLNKDIKVTQDNLKVITSKWYEKHGVAFGDSITWYDKHTYNDKTLESGVKVKGYQSYLEEELGLIINNQGVSGNTTPQICNRIKAFNFTGYDLVTIMCGTNDFRDRATEQIGTIQPIGGSFDETTFIGAYQSMIENILNRYPTIRIQIFTPFKVWQSGEMMPETYIDAVKSVGELYGIPVLNLYHNSGINDLTKDVLIVDDTAKVSYQFHPSTKGYERLSLNCIVPFVDNN